MKNEGSVTLVLIVAVAIAGIFAKYLFDKGTHIVAIANTQRAVEATAIGSAATYSRTLTESLRACIKEKIEEVHACSYSDEVKKCMDQNLNGCGSKIKICIEKSREECEPDFQNMRDIAKAKAESTAEKSASLYNAEINAFDIDDSGKAIVTITMSASSPDEGGFTITRSASATSPDF